MVLTYDKKIKGNESTRQYFFRKHHGNYRKTGAERRNLKTIHKVISYSL